MNDDPLAYWAVCKVKEACEKGGEQTLDISDPYDSVPVTNHETLVSNSEQSKCATSYHGISLKKLASHTGDDWDEIRQNPAAIEVFTKMIQTSRLMKAGIKPPEYTQACYCKNCGWVWLWDGCPHEVLGCPWCIIRGSGVSIPRVTSTQN